MGCTYEANNSRVCERGMSNSMGCTYEVVVV